MGKRTLFQPGDVVELVGRAKAFGTEGIIVRDGRIESGDSMWVVQVWTRAKRYVTLSIPGKDLRRKGGSHD